MPIRVSDLSYTYGVGTPSETKALDSVSLFIDDGEFVGLIGPTGSGKSTLVQHLNGLIRPAEGKVLVDGVDIGKPSRPLLSIRQKVGLVFQYPEAQLFEETVFADVGFGPRNMGLSPEEVRERVVGALAAVHLPAERFGQRSPLQLSGGEKRKAAIAGVLAMRPKVLILDEPTAGLDPAAREEIMGQVHRYRLENQATVVLISHDMDTVARSATRVVVMFGGRVVLDGKPREVFGRGEELEPLGLGMPQVTELMSRLQERGRPVRRDLVTLGEAAEEILKLLQANRCSSFG
ncbi:MAG: energy-coupling factor transporter ATPase [Firmicutes bacterium]|nr:energy-coupling factor transporter ATPase [Bacillota bacterium]